MFLTVHKTSRPKHVGEENRKDKGTCCMRPLLLLGTLCLALVSITRVATATTHGTGTFMPPATGAKTLQELEQRFPAQCRGRELVFAGSGGKALESYEVAILNPYSELFGVKIVVDRWSAAKLKAMVDTGQVSWDVVGDTTPTETSGLGGAYLEKIDWGLVDGTDMLPGTMTPYFLPVSVFSTVMVINTRTYPDSGKAPKSWADFWDVEKFPGRRSLNNTHWGFYASLFSLGWGPDQIYPLTREKVERGFEQLRKIKPHINVWWEKGAQPAQMLVDNQIDMTISWNGRAQAPIDEGQPLRIVWEAQHFGGAAGFAIPKGAPNKGCAMYVLAYAALPEVQARKAELLPSGPANTKSGSLVSDAQKVKLPTAPASIGTFYVVDRDLDFWSKNLDWVVEQYLRLLVE